MPRINLIYCMKSNFINIFKEDFKKINDYFFKLGYFEKEINIKEISFEISKEKSRGNISSNVILIYRKFLNIDFDEFKKNIKSSLESLDYINKIEITNKGFLNIFFEKKFIFNQLNNLLIEKDKFGKSNIGKNQKINIEFVSANPTGPLHIAHSRGAVFGDVLSNMMKSLGYEVTREYYMNDTGSQIEILAHSLFIRYKELYNIFDETLGSNSYPGDYLIDIANEIKKNYGEKWIKEEKDLRIKFFKEYAIEKITESIVNDLKLIGIVFDNFISEKEIVKKKYIDLVFEKLKKKNLLYEGILEKPKGENDLDWEPRKQLLFKSSELGDDLDRPFLKSNNEWTYFANDSAYHYFKIERKFSKLINIWGSDHIGYIKRMQSIVNVLSDNKIPLNVKVCQLVHLKKNNKLIKMSKRQGNIITIKDIANDVGSDILRFFMIYRKSDSQMDFDIDKVKEETKDNPIFYIQYAYARSNSVINLSKETFKKNNFNLDLKFEDFYNYISDDEYEIINLILYWPELIENAVLNEEPHRIIYYLENLSNLFHSFWNKGKEDVNLRFIHDNNFNKTLSKILWIKSMQIVFNCAFKILGIKLLEKM